MGALNAPDLDLSDPHKVFTDNVIKYVKINLIVRQRLHKNDAPIFMGGGLRSSHSTYHDFPVINLLRHKSRGEETMQDQLYGTPFPHKLLGEQPVEATIAPRAATSEMATGSSTVPKWKRVL
jgi:hypothetical protein